MTRIRKGSLRETLELYLLLQGTFLAALSCMHIVLAAASLLVNGAGIYFRRSAMPVILLLLTLPLVWISLVNAVYFHTALPFILGGASIAVSLAGALAVRWLRRLWKK